MLEVIKVKDFFKGAIIFKDILGETNNPTYYKQFTNIIASNYQTIQPAYQKMVEAYDQEFIMSKTKTLNAFFKNQINFNKFTYNYSNKFIYKDCNWPIYLSNYDPNIWLNELLHAYVFNAMYNLLDDNNHFVPRLQQKSPYGDFYFINSLIECKTSHVEILDKMMLEKQIKCWMGYIQAFKFPNTALHVLLTNENILFNEKQINKYLDDYNLSKQVSVTLLNDLNIPLVTEKTINLFENTSLVNSFKKKFLFDCNTVDCNFFQITDKDIEDWRFKHKSLNISQFNDLKKTLKI